MSAEVLDDKTYYYLYKTTNLINNKIYIGVHATKRLDDNYIGSGKILVEAIHKYGRKNFKKEILEFFDSKEEMFNREAEIVNEEFIAKSDNYNAVIGGIGGYKGHSKDGRRRISIGSKNKVVAINKITGKTEKVDRDYFYDNRDIYDGATKGYPTYKSTGFATMKDAITGEHYFVKVDDPRILLGKLVGITAGCTQTEESNKKRSNTQKGRPLPHLKNTVICECCGKEMTIGNYSRWHKNGKCLDRLK